MGRCLDPIKEIERRKKIGLSLIGNKRAVGYIPTEEVLKKRSNGLIEAHERKEFGFKKGLTPWNKNTHIQNNTGRTHFEKGQHPITEFKKGCMSWNKNLTKADKRIKEWHEKGAKTQKQLYVEGKLVIWNKNIKTGFLSKNPEETRRKLSETHKGEKHWNWQNGISFEPYPQEWSIILRKDIRKRDYHICQLCGAHEKGNIAYDVHHIDYNKKNCNPNNLITLCRKCNVKVNKNREYWTEYFQTLMYFKYNSTKNNKLINFNSCKYSRPLQKIRF